MLQTTRLSFGRGLIGSSLRVAGLFAGIGGIELGLQRAGHYGELLSEIDEGAQRVLEKRFDHVPIQGDVRQLRALPRVDVVAGGFPCTDLSQAGRTAGIGGQHSSLVGEAIRLVTPSARTRPTWLLLENVPFMLQLDRGKAMHYLTDTLTSLGFMWAYRIVDTRSFGLPQRRRRVIMLASRTEDPRTVLFADDAGEPPHPQDEGMACGFYWTEGLRGLGWAIDAVPTLKGGSSVGIPSPPAIWMPEGGFVTPDLRDAERLQGFPADWTLPAQEAGYRAGARWKMVGNAVSVPVFDWVGRRLAAPGDGRSSTSTPIAPGAKWPEAGWGAPGVDPQATHVSAWPVRRRRRHLKEFLAYPPKPLSTRAVEGFYKRTQRSSLRFPDGFIDALEEHLSDARIAVA